jgi:hypothetical protein
LQTFEETWSETSTFRAHPINAHDGSQEHVVLIHGTLEA